MNNSRTRCSLIENTSRSADGPRRPAHLQDRGRGRRHRAGIAKAAPRAVEHHHARAATGGVGRDAALRARQAAAAPVAATASCCSAYADRLLRLAEEAKAAVAGSAPRGVVRLGALESTTASRLPAILARLHRSYPDLRVELTTGTNDALTAAVARPPARCRVRGRSARAARSHASAAVRRAPRAHHVAGAPAGQAGRRRGWRLGDRLSQRLRLSPRARTLARRQEPCLGARARARLIPCHRRVRCIRHRCRRWCRSRCSTRCTAARSRAMRCPRCTVMS